MKTKADYYEWLMMEHGRVSETMRKVPKLSIEEQSKSVNMVEYSVDNMKKINELKTTMLRLENEANRITRYL
jgi:hypothetical protein